MPPCKRSLGFKDFVSQIKLHSSSLQGHSERMQKDEMYCKLISHGGKPGFPNGPYLRH